MLQTLHAKKIDSKASRLLRELNLYRAPVDITAVAKALRADRGLRGT